MTHLSAEDLAAYLDDTLVPDGRRAVEAHLADCADCRADMLETRRILSKTDRGPSRIRLLAPLAAAAVVATVFLLPGSESHSDPRLRNDGSIGSGAPERLAEIPVREAEIGADGEGRISLAWASVGEHLDYRVTVTDPSGETVWSDTLTETRVTLPADVELGGDSVFFWFVDATLESGEAATSGIREFRIR